MPSLRAELKPAEVSFRLSGVRPVSGTSKPFSRMHCAKTRLGSLLAAFEDDAEGLLFFWLFVFELVDPHALRAAARVMAITARPRTCARFFIETPCGLLEAVVLTATTDYSPQD